MKLRIGRCALEVHEALAMKRKKMRMAKAFIGALALAMG